MAWGDSDLFSGVVELNNLMERVQAKLQEATIQVILQEQPETTGSITTTSSSEMSRPKMDVDSSSPPTNGGAIPVALLTGFSQLRKMMQFGMKHYVVTNRLKRMNGSKDVIKNPAVSSPPPTKFDPNVNKFVPNK